ncbi:MULTISPECIES: metal ABC transporter ATP-binding protein [unclassified Agarivorans]|uniref:metal ABC transporter ATP-binding protein n=1 Tax=unclassified Agarivorans TaxID=2636026 RepID=UPI0026E48DC1|nr:MULTISPECIES: metal ABC transporter ATP-binding protein [unclassified Agarivorans]MDO6686676.1 metal ABC transporter ATP-binding protein [Agarivorans sp. 3_MG-2023]MDO6716594.1 metal ABC transporter ATP-binding protein [Agarivorans sp. 2_MG-2023]
MQAIVEMDALTIGHHANQAVVNDVQAFIPSNGMLALVGPNGAGKSTLLKTILGVIKPLSGDLVYHINPRHDIAYMPQLCSVERSFPINLKQFVSAGLWAKTGWWRPMRRYQQEVQQALAQVEIENLASKMLSELSGGQLQRALFARMLLQRSKLLLLDEPFNGVDEATVSVLLDQLKRCQENGATIVAAIHDLELVKQHFEHCLLFKEGGVVQASSDELLTPHYSAVAKPSIRVVEFVGQNLKRAN